jgi:hypothetical protein
MAKPHNGSFVSHRQVVPKVLRLLNEMGSFLEKISTAILARIRKRRTSPSPADNNHGPSTLEPPPAKLREATFADFDGVSELKQRSGIVADSPENWTRLWRANPALAGTAANRPIGWVLEAGGEIVGYIGNISLQCRYGNKTLSAVATHGFCADPAYRAVALSLASAFYRQKSVDFFVSSSAIEVSGKMALAYKCAAVPQPEYDTVLFWVLRPHSFARILMKELAVRSAISPIASVFVALVVAGDRIFRRRWPTCASTALTVSDGGLNAIGSDIGELWTEKLKEATRLYADRAPEVLRWHFEIPGDRGSVRIFRCHEDGKLKGYAILRSDVDPRDGIRRSIIADLIAKQDDPAVVRALWVAAYEHAKAVGSEILEVQGYPSYIREVSSDWRPYRRKYPACPYYYRATDPELHKALSNPAAWYACPYDGDATLIRPSYPSSDVRLAPQENGRPQTDKGVDLVEIQGLRRFDATGELLSDVIEISRNRSSGG